MGLVLNLGLVVETISAGHAPAIVAELIDTVRWSLVVVVGLLAQVDPQGRTQHDPTPVQVNGGRPLGLSVRRTPPTEGV